jgi:hypothetical protein
MTTKPDYHIIFHRVAEAHVTDAMVYAVIDKADEKKPPLVSVFFDTDAPEIPKALRQIADMIDAAVKARASWPKELRDAEKAQIAAANKEKP